MDGRARLESGWSGAWDLEPLHGILKPTLLSSHGPSLGSEEESTTLGVLNALQGLLHGHVCKRNGVAISTAAHLLSPASNSGFQLQLPTGLVGSGTESGAWPGWGLAWLPFVEHQCPHLHSFDASYPRPLNIQLMPVSPGLASLTCAELTPGPGLPRAPPSLPPPSSPVPALPALTPCQRAAAAASRTLFKCGARLWRHGRAVSDAIGCQADWGLAALQRRGAVLRVWLLLDGSLRMKTKGVWRNGEASSLPASSRSLPSVPKRQKVPNASLDFLDKMGLSSLEEVFVRLYHSITFVSRRCRPCPGDTAVEETGPVPCGAHSSVGELDASPPPGRDGRV
ncbi:uncharacterized protein LOC122494301 [Prionailurus bengalensis]|uniref:uncharacterized protein LOC122494301 n=1 Tax=Prionailurus bengalensis TaxID=37029 RepID=UPI001CA95210|nr:uncharacterized protein LOC122494301 [Prionailurus bengalensis]